MVKVFADGEILTADDINDHLNPATGVGIAYATAAGVQPVTLSIGTDNSQGEAYIAFPAGRFTVPPLVLLTPRGSTSVAAMLYAAPTTSGVTVRVRRVDAGTTQTTVQLQWLAIQMTDTTAEG